MGSEEGAACLVGEGQARGKMTVIFKFFFFGPHHMACGNLSSTTDLTCAPCNGRAWSPNYWSTREVLMVILKDRQTEGHLKENGAQRVTETGERWR